MPKGKPFEISKAEVMAAFEQVKRNGGAGGVDGIRIDRYEENLADNLYKLWNRMSSGSYMPKPVKGVEIPKKDGRMRLLGIPTVEDRIAQTVVRNRLEAVVEPLFLDSSYGYRPNKSALNAIGAARTACWDSPWVIEFDIVGLFDNIDHELLMEAVSRHAQEKWELLYIARFLKVPMVLPDETKVERCTGTPQGGVISPVLANIFMHYA
ncbi:MAG: reverse transcriptase domain-containing protein, partial [Gordonibacter sp.]|uniref:reverse transcriptase domain-containing protein n=1 Tax=Gordonibacter sp. TaxID=1968902 RepID=UPI002FC8FBF1